MDNKVYPPMERFRCQACGKSLSSSLSSIMMIMINSDDDNDDGVRRVGKYLMIVATVGATSETRISMRSEWLVITVEKTLRIRDMLRVTTGSVWPGLMPDCPVI